MPLVILAISSPNRHIGGLQASGSDASLLYLIAPGVRRP
jgi:hypothetical protein